MGLPAGVDTVVVGAGVVDASGDADVVVELAGAGLVVVFAGTVVVVIGAVVVVVGAVVVVKGAVVVVRGAVVVGTVVGGSDVTVTVDGSAGTVTVLGSAVTVTVDVSVGEVVTVAVESGAEVDVSGCCLLDGVWIEMLAVAEKLALTEASVEFAAGGSAGMAVVDSGAVAVPVPGSAVGWTVSMVVAVSVPVTSPGAETSHGGPGGVLVIVTLVRLRTVLWPKTCTAGSPESVARIGGLESACTISVVPIAAVTDAATTPACAICRRNRAAEGLAACRSPQCRVRDRDGSVWISGAAGRSPLLSKLFIQPVLSPTKCVDFRMPVTTFRTAFL